MSHSCRSPASTTSCVRRRRGRAGKLATSHDRVHAGRLELSGAERRLAGVLRNRRLDLGRLRDQPEVDRLWSALTADGGSEILCGWLRDRWGVPWQIVPANLPRLLGDADPAVAARAFTAMTGMVKLDMAELDRAAKG